MTVYFLLCFIVTAMSALVSLGFSLFYLFTSKDDNHTANSYTASRSTALFVLSIVPVFIYYPSDAEVWLVAGAVAMTIVQTLDAGVGIMSRDKTKVIGPALLATINFIVLVLFLQNN